MPNIAEKFAKMDPKEISLFWKPSRIQVVIGDAQTAVITMHSALQAVLNEVASKNGHVPYSADSYLPPHLVEIIRSALGLPPGDAS